MSQSDTNLENDPPPTILTEIRVSETNTWENFYRHGLTLIPVYIINYMSDKVWDKIIHTFNNATIMDIIAYPCWD